MALTPDPYCQKKQKQLWVRKTRVTAKHPPENPLAHRLRNRGPELRAEPGHPARGVRVRTRSRPWRSPTPLAVEKPEAPGGGRSLRSDRGSAVPQGGGVGRLSADSPRNQAGQENWTACQITAHSPSRAVLLHPAPQVWPHDLLWPMKWEQKGLSPSSGNVSLSFLPGQLVKFPCEAVPSLGPRMQTARRRAPADPSRIHRSSGK